MSTVNAKANAISAKATAERQEVQKEQQSSTVCPMFVEALCNLLQGCVVPKVDGPPTVFHGVAGLPIASYVRRLVKYTYAQEEDLIVAVILLDRLGYRYPACKLSSASFHRTFLMSLVTSLKSREDFHYTNTYYAQVGGVPLKQFNHLEREFLVLLDFDVFVGETEFSEFCSAVCQLFPFGQKLEQYAAASQANTPSYADERSSDAMSNDGCMGPAGDFSGYDDAASYTSYTTYQSVPFYPNMQYPEYPQSAHYHQAKQQQQQQQQQQAYAISPQHHHHHQQQQQQHADASYGVWYSQYVVTEASGY